MSSQHNESCRREAWHRDTLRLCRLINRTVDCMSGPAPLLDEGLLCYGLSGRGPSDEGAQEVRKLIVLLVRSIGSNSGRLRIQPGVTTRRRNRGFCGSDLEGGGPTSRGSLTFEESEANRKNPVWGRPVMQLGVHASHWLESAAAKHPELTDGLRDLGDKLSVAMGELADADDTHGHIFRGTSTEGEIVLALEEIVAIMKQVAPLLVDQEKTA